jgi:hypothetical protein
MFLKVFSTRDPEVQLSLYQTPGGSTLSIPTTRWLKKKDSYCTVFTGMRLYPGGGSLLPYLHAPEF